MKKNILAIFILVAIIIILIGYLNCNKTANDYNIFSKNYNFTKYKLLDNYLNGWELAHFILYGILTYIYPKEWFFIFMIGILWEFIEEFFSQLDLKYCFHKNYEYWYSRYEDIIMNSLGIGTALIIKKFI
jgi:hypothetical protein|uniref:VanZ-like domain-containing protein n=1 Tax=viral metagenome TaxID=1070528 RepID=A0A6C0JPP1_9ZZZZ